MTDERFEELKIIGYFRDDEENQPYFKEVVEDGEVYVIDTRTYKEKKWWPVAGKHGFKTGKACGDFACPSTPDIREYFTKEGLL